MGKSVCISCKKLVRVTRRSLLVLTGISFISGHCHLIGYFRWMEQHAFQWKSNVEFINTSDHTAVLGLAGPKSRDVLRKLTSVDLGDAAFPFMTSQKMTVAGIPIRAIRISYTGTEHPRRGFTTLAREAQAKKSRSHLLASHKEAAPVKAELCWRHHPW